MEVELDLWSSRSNDPVDHILSDVDCCSVPDVDEFILGCSSNSDLAKNDLNSSVDMHLNQHLNHHHQLGQHASLLDEPTGSLAHHHHHHHHNQSASPTDEDLCDDLSSHHASLTNLVEHLSEPAQQQQQQQQQPRFGQDATGPAHLLSPQQQQQQHYQQLEAGYQLVSSQPSGTSSSAPLYSRPSGQQHSGRILLNNERNLVNESLVASRVDHCYILNDINHCQQQQHHQVGSIQQQQQQQVVSNEPKANQFLSQQFSAGSGGAAVSSSAITSTSASLGGMINQHQLQLLLNGQPQAVGVALPAEEPRVAAGKQSKRRQPSASAAQKRIKNQEAKGNTQTVSSSSVGSVSCKAQKGAKVGSSTTSGSSPPASTARGRRATAKRNTKPSDAQPASSVQNSCSGQVSPVLSLNSSSGVSSLSYSSSNSNSSSNCGESGAISEIPLDRPIKSEPQSATPALSSSPNSTRPERNKSGQISSSSSATPLTSCSNPTKSSANLNTNSKLKSQAKVADKQVAFNQQQQTSKAKLAPKASSVQSLSPSDSAHEAANKGEGECNFCLSVVKLIAKACFTFLLPKCPK